MRYLGLALYAEGKGDYYFLPPLLLRLCEDICAADSPHQTEIGGVQGLDHPVAEKDAPRVQRIVAAARAAAGAWNILFVHADGAGDPASARRNLAQPALDLLQSEFDGTGIGVAVVPIRETEAWAIRDGDAMRQVFGTTLSDAELGLPATAQATESDQDPKATLDRAWLATNPPKSAMTAGVALRLNSLGEQVSLTLLRELSAFRRLEAELRLALKQLSILE